MSSSTDHPVGFTLDRVPDDELASMLNVARKDVAARRKTLAAQHADPAWIARTLDALPAATLAVLHLVCDGGGIVLEDHLFREGQSRFGLSEDDCRAAAIPAIERLLAIPLTTPHGDIALGIVLPAGKLVAPLVAGLDLLELAPAAFVPVEHAVRNARTFLAVCVATRHVDVKLTNEGRPHRSATKRLAKQVGLDEALIEELLINGLSSGLLTIEGEGELLRPDPEALAAAANGRYPYCPVVAAAQDRLGLGPLPVHGLLDSLLRRRELAVGGYVGLDAFDYLPGFVTGTVEGTHAVMLRMIEGSAAGHVTPSFEVMLPPESRLLDVVQVGACCDWDRLDRAIVGRISKASVMRAVAGGSSAAEIVAQLGAASRHPIPQNVEAAIHDWAGSVIAATIASGHVIVVEPGARDRVAPGLVGLGGRELAPGVFLVERDDARRQIEAVLARAGALHRAPAGPRPALRTTPAAAPASPAAARVRARVSAWQRREEFEGKRDDFLELSRKIADAELGALRQVEQQLASWERKRGDALDHDDPAHHALVGILASLPADTRNGMLASSHDMGELLRALSKVAPSRGLISVPRSSPAARVPSAPRMPRSSRRPPRPPPLLWQDDGVRARIEQAAEDVEALALQLPTGVRYVEVDRVLRRGTTWMVLGNDVRTGDSVAVRLDDIQAIAAMPDDLDAYDLSLPSDLSADERADVDVDVDAEAVDAADAADAPRRPWRPAPGEAGPAGHLPCPCGSGTRYRSCCRDLPRA
jgi:Helicase conserved C-terminal domain